MKGNVIFHKSARNFNPDIAVAGKRCIVEVEELLPTGSLDPDMIHLPSIYVDKIFQGERYDHPIENLVLKKKGEKVVLESGSEGRERIARRATKEIQRGMYVNLGIGIPTLCANYLSPDQDVMFHSENGFLGLGEYPCKEELDADLINAGKFAVTIRPGGAFFQSSESFAMIRGGHLDLTILGALQVSERGDLANWIIPGKMVKGMGGAMDLVAGAERIIITMDHQSKGAHKILEKCSLPLTGRECVDMCITDKAVFTWEKKSRKMTLTEVAKGLTVEDIKAVTPCSFEVSRILKEF